MQPAPRRRPGAPSQSAFLPTWPTSTSRISIRTNRCQSCSPTAATSRRLPMDRQDAARSRNASIRQGGTLHRSSRHKHRSQPLRGRCLSRLGGNWSCSIRSKKSTCCVVFALCSCCLALSGEVGSLWCIPPPGLKAGRCLEGTLILAPVAGFCRLWARNCFTKKTPKPRSSTRSPRDSASVIAPKTIATVTSARRLVRFGWISVSLETVPP